jgi:membrane-associated phospholipid phosphatase
VGVTRTPCAALLLTLCALGASGCAATLSPGQKVLYGDEIPVTVRRVTPPHLARAAATEELTSFSNLTATLSDRSRRQAARHPIPWDDFENSWFRKSALVTPWRGALVRAQTPEADPSATRPDRPTATGHAPLVPSPEPGSDPLSADWVPPDSTVSAENAWPDTAWNRARILGRRMTDDQWNFYDVDTLAPLAISLGGAAILANSSTDREFAEWYQDKVFNDDTDKASSWVKWIGDGYYTLPAYAVLTALSLYPHEIPGLEPLETWGERSLRATVVGVLPLVFLQRAVGTGRPTRAVDNDRWDFWSYPNGVSGHTFIAAVPFLTAARMVDDPLLKAALYVGSGLTGWSRINDNDHYLSQVLVGWFLAYLSVEAVFDTDDQSAHWELVPIPAQHGQGIGLEYRY